MDIILKYFPNLTDTQKAQFAALYDLYTDWNSKINVISRKDITNLYEHHVLHSLGIAKVINFKPGTEVMDLGTGGGFPGIPLAILFPDTHFHLVDSIGKKVRVAVFAKGADAEAAVAAGAEIVGAEDLVAKIQGEGFMDFDVAIAAPNMMGLVGRLGKVLGPRGLMPNPKAGTVAPDLGKAVTEAKAGKIEYRLDKQNIIHVPVGKASFGAEKLYTNLDTVMSAIAKAKPAAAKGTYFKSATIATTMGPGIRLNTLKYGV